MIKKAAWIAVVCTLVMGVGLFCQPQFSAASSQDDWKAEFADVCSKTDDPMVLSNAEVASLIERCDKLRPRIEKLDESAAKVYLKRLKMCKDLFVFVLESKSK
jgi:uncharacterized protein YkvS